MAIPFVYNVRNVLQRPVATAATAIGIGLTVAVLLAALALAEGFRTTLQSAGSPENAIVLGNGADSEVMSGFPRSAGDILRANPRVATGPDGRALVSLEMVATTNLPRVGQKGSSNLRVRGIDPDAIAARATPEIVDGRMFTPGTDEIIVGRGISTRFANCRVGDELKIQKRLLKVVGLFATGGSAYESEVWGDQNVLMPLFHREGGWQVALLRIGDQVEIPAAVAAELRAQAAKKAGLFDRTTPEQRYRRLAQDWRFAQLEKEIEADARMGVEVKREDRFFAEQSAGVSAMVTVLGSFITIIMAVGALFGAVNTMYAAVAGRTREVATLQVLGFRGWSILGAFVTESVIISLLGGALGCLLALPINGIRTSTTNFQSFSEVAFQFRVTPGLMLVALVFSAVLGVLGGFFPALRAARRPLSTTLRGG